MLLLVLWATGKKGKGPVGLCPMFHFMLLHFQPDSGDVSLNTGKPLSILLVTERENSHLL